MKRFLAGLIALALLSSVAAADWYVNPFRHAADTSVRPTLVGTAGSHSTTNASSRTVSVTPPTGTTLMVAFIGWSGDEDAGQVVVTPTIAGTPLTTLNSTAQLGNRITSFFAYQINPTTNVAQNFVYSVTGRTWQNTILRVWFFSGVNTSSPFANNKAVNSSSAQSLSTTFTPSYPRPYIIAGGVARSSSGSGNCYTGTNLTIDIQGNESGFEAEAAATNSSLVFAGSTTFTLSCSASTDYRTLDVVEVKGQ